MAVFRRKGADNETAAHDEPTAPVDGAARDAVTNAVGALIEPELGKSLAQLGVLRDVAVDGDAAHVSLALPGDRWPGVDALTAAVTDAATSVDGIAAAHVNTDVMDEHEQAALRASLIGDPAATAGEHAGHGHAEGRAVPFAQAANPTRVLLVASGKGGVGKSSVTVNLAVALAQQGERTAVVDADVWGFSIPRMLGVARPPVVVDQMVVPVEANGVRCVSMGFFAREDQPIIWRGPMLHKALEQFLTDVYWNDPDYLLVDLPPGTGDISLSLAQFLPKSELLVVTTPQPAAQRVAQRAALMADKVNLKVRAVIENMSYFTCGHGERYEIFGAGGGAELADELGVPLLGRVPLVNELRTGGDVGAPVVAAAPDSEAAQVFTEMARLLREEYLPTRRYSEGLKLVG